MTKTTSYLLLMLITILVGTFFYFTYCSSCRIIVKEEPIKETVVVPEAKVTAYPFAFSDGDYAYETNDNYNFNLSSSSFLNPISPKVMDGLMNLKNFLTENSGKVINITGFYKSDEKNNSAYPNLGLARANAIKNHFVENGIHSNQINTMGKLMDSMVAEDNTFFGPLEFSITGENQDAGEELRALYEKITKDPLVLYFDTNETSINLSAMQRQKVADISRYLDKVEGATCNVVGHTDNVGPSATNIKLGKNRANFAKDYLIKNGILASKIKISSKGEKQPIASNKTAKGKAKNRRTVVTLNK